MTKVRTTIVDTKMIIDVDKGKVADDNERLD